MTERVHVTIPDYQKRFLEEHHINVSGVVQDSIDDWMEEQGNDPDEWRARHGE